MVPVVLPVAVCAVAKPMAPTMAAAAAAVMRSFDAFMCELLREKLKDCCRQDRSVASVGGAAVA